MVYGIKKGGVLINKSILLIILSIGITMFVITTFFYQLCIIHGPSMEPTLKNKDIVLIKKYNLKLDYNDIVVAKKNGKIIIKRLIALPNDAVKIEDYVYVNGIKNDNFFTENNGNISNEIKLNSDEYFILGDNRQNSIDSRFEEIGVISKKEIIGKIVIPKK